MLFAQTAATNSTVVVKLFNLVDWFIVHYQLSSDSALFFMVYAVGILACTLIPYLLGSINPAILISRLVYHEDIRNFGSGNAGTTNMLRTYGKKAAIFTLLLDLLKAALACFWGLLVWKWTVSESRASL